MCKVFNDNVQGVQWECLRRSWYSAVFYLPAPKENLSQKQTFLLPFRRFYQLVHVCCTPTLFVIDYKDTFISFALGRLAAYSAVLQSHWHKFALS